MRVLLLLAVGLIVGEFATIGDRRDRSHAADTVLAFQVRRVAARICDGAVVDEVWHEVLQSIVGTLGVSMCRFERADVAGVVLTDLANTIVTPQRLTFGHCGFVLPAKGCQLSVRSGKRVLGRIALEGGAAEGASAADRATAGTLADLLALALARSASPIPEQLL